MNPAVHRIEGIRGEYIRKLEQIKREKNMEIKIIRQSLRRTQQEQIDDINKSFKFEIDGIK